MTALKSRSTQLFALSAACVAFSAPALSQGAGPCTPRQVYFLMHEAVQQALGVDPDTPQPVWVSLTTVGSVVEGQRQRAGQRSG